MMRCLTALATVLAISLLVGSTAHAVDAVNVRLEGPVRVARPEQLQHLVGLEQGKRTAARADLIDAGCGHRAAPSGCNSRWASS